MNVLKVALEFIIPNIMKMNWFNKKYVLRIFKNFKIQFSKLTKSLSFTPDLRPDFVEILRIVDISLNSNWKNVLLVLKFFDSQFPVEKTVKISCHVIWSYFYSWLLKRWSLWLNWQSLVFVWTNRYL